MQNAEGRQVDRADAVNMLRRSAEMASVPALPLQHDPEKLQTFRTRSCARTKS